MKDTHDTVNVVTIEIKRVLSHSEKTSSTVCEVLSKHCRGVCVCVCSDDITVTIFPCINQLKHSKQNSLSGETA